MTKFPWQPWTIRPCPFPKLVLVILKEFRSSVTWLWWLGGHTISMHLSTEVIGISFLHQRLSDIILTDIQWILVCQQKDWRQIIMIEPTVNDVLALPKFILLLTNMYVHSKLMIITGSLNGNLYMWNAHIRLTYVYTGQRGWRYLEKSKKLRKTQELSLASLVTLDQREAIQLGSLRKSSMNCPSNNATGEQARALR